MSKITFEVTVSTSDAEWADEFGTDIAEGRSYFWHVFASPEGMKALTEAVEGLTGGPVRVQVRETARYPVLAQPR